MLAESAASAAKLYKEQEEKQKAQEQEREYRPKIFQIYSKLFQKKILPQFPSDTSNILRLNAISITFEMKVA